MAEQPYVRKAPAESVVSADFALKTGRPIRPLHGVNSGPMTKVFTYDARPQFIEAGFPYARLHDVEYPYGSGYFVDIPNIFRVFDKDESDPANYDFDLTDEYIAKIVEVGCNTFFRLGVSIEHAPVIKRTFPPKDFGKWARIAEHIIRHYNEGWASGFHWNIEYWEIWNEADGSLSGGKQCWAGTAEEFYEFYCTAASHLKRCFPHLKIGGPAFTRAKNEFTIGFFEYLKKQTERVPLDFYSWHCYFHDLDNLRSVAKDAEDLLTEYGYEDAESILNEWNVGGKVKLERFQEFDPHGEKFRAVYDQRGSSMAAATFAILQTETDVRIGCYFEADVVKEWCGLYRVKDMSIGRVKATVAPTNVFYAFKSFNELYKLGNEVAVRLTDPALNGVAAVSEDGRKWGLLLSNYSREPRNIKLSLKHIARAKATLRKGNDAHLFEIMSTGVPKSIELEPYTFVFLGNVLS